MRGSVAVDPGGARRPLAEARVPSGAGRRFEALVLSPALARRARICRLMARLAAAGVEVYVARAGAGPEASPGARPVTGPQASSDQPAPGPCPPLAGPWSRGIRPSDVAVLVTQGRRAARGPVVGDESAVRGVATFVVDGPATAAILSDQLRRRRRGNLPDPPAEADWTVAFDGADPALERSRDAVLTMSDGVAGTRGSPLVAYPPARREVLLANLYVDAGDGVDLLRAPDWTRLAGRLAADRPVRRVLDLRTGTVHHALETAAGPVRAITFASLARPGLGVLRAVGGGVRRSRSGPLAGGGQGHLAPVRGGRAAGLRLAGRAGGAAIAAEEAAAGAGSGHLLDRLVVVRSDPWRRPGLAAARRHLERARADGFEALLAEQRAAWASRWSDADIGIEGDDDLQRAARFALYHLIGSAAARGEAAVGARGLTGGHYLGHVFWDADVFILPFFAASHPPAARAMLEYRVRRLPAAREAARAAGWAGAWLPWESADDGRDVTPSWARLPNGETVPVWHGERQLHIVADVAWAAQTYAAWTGDRAFARGPGRELVVDTARFWQSRFEVGPDGRAHLRGVTGPDEYHELVDDNAYTNVMARWNLRQAARLGVASGAGPEERAGWLDLADRIVDGHDPRTGLYEQFAGFFALEPLKIGALTARPVQGDLFVGRERMARVQIVKMADVLMLHHLVPEEVAPGSLEPNLAFYEPRTAHGSSLSPGIHAALLARANRLDAALEALRMTAFLDLDVSTGAAGDGLHVAGMGSLWQALVLGFAGLRPAGAELTLDPRLPSPWRALCVPFRFRGRRVRVRIEHGRLEAWADRPVVIRVPGSGRIVVGRSGALWRRGGQGWVASS